MAGVANTTRQNCKQETTRVSASSSLMTRVPDHVTRPHECDGRHVLAGGGDNDQLIAIKIIMTLRKLDFHSLLPVACL